jgi:hypothetical protein
MPGRMEACNPVGGHLGALPGLSERKMRTCLDRLEAGGISRPTRLPPLWRQGSSVQRGRDVHVGMSVHAAGDGACLYDGHVIPFSR